MNFYVKRYGEYSRRARRPGKPYARFHLIWTLLITIYFIAGFASLGARWFVTTQLNDHREAMEALFTDAFGVVIKADEIEGGFHLIRPTIVLRNATLSRPNGPVSLTLPKVEAELSWSSLWHLEPRFYALVVTSPTLTVRRLSAYKFDIAGFVIDVESLENETEDADDVRSRQPFTSWLLGQDQLVLRNGTFTYIDETLPNPQPVIIKNTDAVFDQSLLDWRAAVRATLVEGALVKHFEAKARIEKKILSRNDSPLTWTGEGYFHSDRINGANILRRIGLSRFLSSGEGAARAWIKFDRGHIASTTADLALRDVAARFDNNLSPIRLSQLSGRFSYENNGQGMHVVRAQALQFTDSRKLRFGPAELGGTCDTDAAGDLLGCHFFASEISIDTLSRLSPSLPIPEDARQFLKSKPVSGMLRNVEASVRGDFTHPGNWSFNGGFTGLTLPAGTDALPGFRNVSGAVFSSRPGTFDLTLDSHVTQLTFPDIFRNPKLDFDSITGNVRIETEPRLKLTFQNITVKNSDAVVTGAGYWEASGGAGTIDIGGKILSARGESVHKYLPKVIGNVALNYVESAVLAGKASNGSWTVRGKLNAFPWDGAHKGEGLFKIDADVENGILDFMPSHRITKSGNFVHEEYWPLLKNIKAHLLFEGNRMLITGQSASSHNLSASNVRVEIPSYIGNNAKLTVSGRIDGDLNDAIGYINTSRFLRSILGESFATSTGKGNQTSTLTLELPFHDPEKTTFSVESTLKGAEFRYLPMLPAAQKLSGTLRFDNSGVHGRQPIRGELGGAPLSISAQTKNHTLRLAFNGRLLPEDGRRMLNLPWTDPLFEHVSGYADTQVELEIPFNEPNQWQLTGKSNLSGLALHLPAPFEKQSQIEWPLSFEWRTISEDGIKQQVSTKITPDKIKDESDVLRSLSIALDNRATLEMRFSERNGSLRPESGAISFGEKIASKPSGFDIKVIAPELDLDAWTRVFAPANAGTQYAASKEKLLQTLKGDFLSKLSSISLQTNTLHLGRETFSDVDSTLRHIGQIWHVRLQSDAASGQIEFTEPLAESGQPSLSMKLLRLHLPASYETAVGEDISSAPRNWLPNLDVVVDDLRIGPRNIGKVEVKAQNDLEGGRDIWRISHFAIRNQGGTLTGTGRWLSGGKDNPAGTSAIALEADVKSMGEVLQSLNVIDVVHDAPGALTLKAEWRGMPIDFNFETLNGEITGKTGAGQLIQVEPGAGRILSLLSMQHLMRRLTLDFRDVAGRGFGFDSISTNATVTNGILHTEKTSLLGSAATVLIGGDIDLVNEVLDLRAIVLPSINAEGASVALAIANPAVGIGTLLAQLVLKDQISKFLSSEYAIRGTFDAPDVQKLSRAETQKDAVDRTQKN